MKNLFRSGRGLKWWPDADATNAGEGMLLRADNLLPDPETQLALRPGASKLYSGIQTRVHTLYTCLLDGKSFRFAGCDDKLYRNGVDFGETFDGNGDIAVGDDAYQAFFARGTTKKKFDGQNLYDWSIKAPEFPAVLQAVPAITVTVASFQGTPAAAEVPPFVINEGTSAFVTGQDGVAGGALKLIPGASSRASASKIFAADQDYMNILGAPGGSTDLFDIFVWLEEPREVDKITIMFGLGTGADAYKDDYYYFDFPIKDAGTVDVKDAGSSAAASYAIYADRVQSALSPNEITNVKNPEQVTSILKRLGRFAGPRSRERKDAQEASPAWTHLSVTRGQFNRVGGTAGRDWQTVRAFKVVFSAMPGSSKVAYFDSAVWTGGGNRSLTGRFRLGYRFVRDFKDKYFEVSPISVISDPIDLTQQALQVTIPAQSLAGKDPQVNLIWVYLIGGFLDTYYRFAVVPAVIRQGMTIDEISSPAGSNFQTKGERTRLTSWGFTRITGGDTIAADLVFTLRTSELEALIENEVLEPGSVGAPDQIVAVAGPFNSRMFVLTEEGRLYPSSQDSPSTFSLYHHLDLRRYGTPLWAILTSGGVYVGMTKDIVRIAGTGDESDDRVSVDLFPEPLHVGNPPVDSSVVTDGNAIVYRSADGLMMLAGTALVPITPAGTSLLWRGQDRHDVQALNTAYGRFRLAIDNHVIFMTAPEGPSYTPPIVEAERIVWSSLTGLTESVTGVLSRSFVWDINGANNKIDYIGHLGVLGVATVPTAVYTNGADLATAITTALAGAVSPTHALMTVTFNSTTRKFHYDKDPNMIGDPNAVLFLSGANAANGIGPAIGFTFDTPTTIGADHEDGIEVFGTGPIVSLATASRVMRSGEGYIEAILQVVCFQAVGLSHVYSNGVVNDIDFCLLGQADGTVVILENGTQIPGISVPYTEGDVARVEVELHKVKYKLNGVTIYTSTQEVKYQLVAEISIDTLGNTLGPVSIFGNWTLAKDGTSALWRYNLLKQQWSRSTYGNQFLSLFRELDGTLLGGTDDGEVWEFDVGIQDDEHDIHVHVRTPIDDGGDPLSRKDPLDFQVHADTGDKVGEASFFVDGEDVSSYQVSFITSRPEVFRANILQLGVFLKAQLRIDGDFSRFLLHAFNMTYRNRVQEVMVLDTGTISPQGNNQMVWLSEAEIDCISAADLEMDLYLDDVLKTTQPVPIFPGRRSIYRIPLPRGSKARCPRIVFRATVPNGTSDPGFEAYRVRVRDRGTGTGTDNEFRPIWPLAEAP